MRVFGRFLYAMFAVGVFLVVFQYSIQLMYRQYIEDLFGASLTDESSDLPDFYYFYASLPNYHKAEPVISIDIDGYQIRAYEIARTNIDDVEGLLIEEYLFFLVYHEDVNELKKVDKIRFSNGVVRDRVDIDLISYKELDIFASVNPLDSQFLISKERFDFEKDYNTLELIDQNQGIVSESAFIISDNDFTIKESIEDFYQNHDELPVDELNVLKIYKQDSAIINNFQVVDDYIYILGIAMGIYFVVLIIATYFLYFKKRKEKKKPYEV